MRLRFLAPLIVLLAACQKSDDLLFEPPLLWVAAEVSPVRRDPATGDATVPLQVLNDRASAVYLRACGDRPSVTIDRRVGGKWENAGEAICQAIYPMTPIEVAARSGRPFTVSVREAGVYRVVSYVALYSPSGEFRGVASSEFRVE
jgi:hypothetical protein